jgi:hypothetical protein
MVLLSSGGQASVEGDLEGVQCCLPAVDPPFLPGSGRVQAHHGEVDALERGLLGLCWRICRDLCGRREGCEVGDSRFAEGRASQPSVEPGDVDGRGSKYRLHASLGDTPASASAQVEGSDGLGYGALDAGAAGV